MSIPNYSNYSWPLTLPEREKAGELWHWLYKEIRTAILEERLPSGARLPSTRFLAEQLCISRATVVTAFQRLCDEGLARMERGSGTYVHLDTPQQTFIRTPRRILTPSRAIVLSGRADTLLHETKASSGFRVTGKAFRSCEPALDLFPRDLWGRVASRVVRRAPLSLYTYGNAAGYGPLRRAIAEYVGGTRGVVCSPEQVVVTTGTQQGLYLIAQVLLNPGDRVWVEDPGYDGARYAFRAAGATILPIPVDEEGFDVAAGKRTSPMARMAYVTPANQYPLGITMSNARRADLLKWAREEDAWIIEDEFDAEYRYSGPTIASLQSEDRSGSVLYVGTFSKILFGSLRLGFVVLPEVLVESFVRFRYAVDRQVSTIDQAILAEFISEGHLGHHLQRMRSAYCERAEIFCSAVAQHLGGLLSLSPAQVGMRTVGWLRRCENDELAAQKAQRAGLEVAALSSFSVLHPSPPGLLLGFASCNERALLEGTALLARALA